MKQTTIKTMVCALGWAVLAATACRADDAQGEYREFTGANGKVIKAVLVDKTDGTATLLLANGSRATVPFEKLSEADREYVKAWRKDAAVFIKKCRGLSVRELLELRGYESFPFRLKNNSILVDGKLNGKPARFLIDTGAGTSLLHEAFATKAGCKIGPMTETIYGVAGEAKAGWTKADTIQMGESVFKDQRILATDLTNGMPPGAVLHKDAIFGADFLSTLDAVISYKERLMFLRPDLSDKSVVKVDKKDGADGETALMFRIFDFKDHSAPLRGFVISKTPTIVTLKLVNGRERQVPVSYLVDDDAAYVARWSKAGDQFLRHCGGLKVEELLTLRGYQSFKYRREGNHIFVDGTLNGKKVTYMIDTGADNSLLHLWAAKKYGCEVGPMDKEVFGIGGKAPAAVAKIKELTMGDAKVTNRKVLATDLARFRDDDKLGYAGIFGADFMRELDAVITYRENRIFLIQR